MPMNHQAQATIAGRHPLLSDSSLCSPQPGPSTAKLDSPSSDTTPPSQLGPAAQSKQNGHSRDGPKKKKAARACFHCQKAHLTCDDSRPCQRCLKRNIADTCVEGIRKKAKYLLDDEELERLKAEKTLKQNVKATAAQPLPATATVSAPLPPPTDIFLPSAPSTNTTYEFGSEGANLEYSMIEALLGPLSQGGQDFQNSSSQLWSQSISDSISNTRSFDPVPQTSNQFNFPGQPQPTLFTTSPTQQPDQIYNPSPSSNTTTSLSAAEASPFSTGTISTTFTTPGLHTSNDLYPVRSNPSDVYLRVTAPYDYTAGYHFLMKYLQNGRFTKNEILRVVRALAIFRPSLIALQMPLSHDDEVFVEKCFQRSLIELDKLISMSGTPTAVWRRTGEICLVGLEFSLLTEWPQHELMSGKKYIYEVFENQSTTEYWENFANHAFENTTQSVHTHCVLVKPSGQHIPCTFCFSIRRDLFDLPYVVIGQWLPIL